jgi:hypothetical protein
MMSLANLRPEVQRILAISIPGVVLLFVVFLLVPKLVSIHHISREAEARQQEAIARRRTNETELGILNGQRLAARPQSKDEQLVFLKQLNRILANSHVRLVSYQPPGSATGSTPGNSTVGIVSVIKPLASEVTVSGSFRSMVTLFRSLALADRLFSVENLQIRVESYPRLSATFRLVRYVTPVNVASAPAVAAKSGEG